MKCLSPTVTSEDCRTARNTHQNSLVKLLLGVEQFQVTASAGIDSEYLLNSLLAAFPDADSAGETRHRLAPRAGQVPARLKGINHYIVATQRLVLVGWSVVGCLRRNCVNLLQHIEKVNSFHFKIHSCCVDGLQTDVAAATDDPGLHALAPHQIQGGRSDGKIAGDSGRNFQAPPGGCDRRPSGDCTG